MVPTVPMTEASQSSSIEQNPGPSSTPAAPPPDIHLPPAAIGNAQLRGRSMFGPPGRWGIRLCACFESFFTALFWMGFFCTPCLYAQLMQRLNLTCSGQSPRLGRRATGTCMKVFVFTCITYMLVYFLRGWMIDMLFYVFLFYFFFMGILIRGIIRKRFGIPATHVRACDGLLEDFCLAFCCSCCSGIQMARHTHNEQRYPYRGCSNNGLPTYAPTLWDDLLQHAPPPGLAGFDTPNGINDAPATMYSDAVQSADSEDRNASNESVELV